MADCLPPRIDLANQRVLLFAPRFFGYDQEVAAEIRRRGARVDFLADRPFDSPLLHAAARFLPRLVRHQVARHYRRCIEEFAADHYDYVVVINGQTLSPQLLVELRKRYPAAGFLFYLWDSLENRGNALELARLCDRASTFEPEAARQHGLRFRPLFFSPAFAAPPGPVDECYDVSFIGTAHKDRYRVVSRLDARLARSTRRFWFLYLQARWVLAVYRLLNPALRGARTSDFRFTPLSRTESSAVFWQSRSILDIEHPRQKGLTMRTFETIGAGKKLITTNARIRDYALYDPENVAIIDRSAPELPPGFIEAVPKPRSEAMIYRYSIAGWLDELFAQTDFSAVHFRGGQ